MGGSRLSQRKSIVRSFAKAWYRPLCMHRPPAGGSHGNPHPTARIHIHTGRRSSCVAARGARAGRADAADRRAHATRSGRSGITARLAVFEQALQELGWTVGRNLRIDYRWARASGRWPAEIRGGIGCARARRHPRARQACRRAAATSDAYRPDRVRAVVDPVGAGFVESLARPGGNATGFTSSSTVIGGKWLELLKEIAPRVTRVAVLRESDPLPGSASSPRSRRGAVLGVEVSPINVRDAGEIERAVAAFCAIAPNGGLIVTASALATVHRELIITLAARHRLPAVYPYRYFVAAGGLISYGPDTIDQYPARGRLRRSHPQGREAGRPAGAGADQVRAGDQPQDRQGARPRSAADAARPRRRGDRMRAARVHHAARRRGGGVAARGARAAAERMRRIGVLMSYAADDPEGQARIAAFLQGCSNWAGPTAATCGSISAGRPEMPNAIRRYAAELVALAPDVILASAACSCGHCSSATRTVPIVFASVADPVGAGFVESLARPGGNVTGFMQFEYGISGKWLELLKEIAPGVTRVAVLRDPPYPAGSASLPSIQLWRRRSA